MSDLEPELAGEAAPAEGGAAPTAPTTTRRRNLYIRDEDREVWEKAERLAGESLSQLIANLLRRYVADRENRAQGFERIVLEAKVEGPAAPSGPWQHDLRKVAFWGRWLVGDLVKRKNPIPGITERAIWNGDMSSFGVALTKQEKIAILELDVAEGSEHGHLPRLRLYNSLEEADRDGVWHYVLDLAATALKTELIDELDI